jgi:hypothetical protein
MFRKTNTPLISFSKDKEEDNGSVIKKQEWMRNDM